MTDGGDFDRVVAFQIEEEAVVATSEPQAPERGLQFFHIAGAAGEIAVKAIENLHGGLAVDVAEIGAGLW